MKNYEELLDKITRDVQEIIEVKGVGKGQVKGTEFEQIVYDGNFLRVLMIVKYHIRYVDFRILLLQMRNLERKLD